MSSLQRYSLINTKMQREFILLQGRGCLWKKCKYCDYYNDISEEPFNVNKEVIEKITGKYGVLDVINSGSAMELDDKTISLLQQKVKELNIHTIWFEAHWIYHKRLKEFSKLFPYSNVKYRIGVETFNTTMRDNWNKGIPSYVGVDELSKKFNGVCLLCCVQGQTKEMILNDIDLALKHFEYLSINVFNENSTDIKRDNNLVKWFKEYIVPMFKDEKKIEILIDNTDLGVG